MMGIFMTCQEGTGKPILPLEYSELRKDDGSVEYNNCLVKCFENEEPLKRTWIYENIVAWANYYSSTYYFTEESDATAIAEMVSDWDFDIIFDWLRAVEKKYPELLNRRSPTQRVGCNKVYKRPFRTGTYEDYLGMLKRHEEEYGWIRKVLAEDKKKKKK